MLIKYLNEQLQSEYISLNTYLYYSTKFTDPSIIKELLNFSKDEMGHIIKLTNTIINLGGKPIINFPEVFKDWDEMELLINTMADEESAYHKFEMISKIIDDPKEKSIILDAANDEKLHYLKIKEIYNTILENTQS